MHSKLNIEKHRKKFDVNKGAKCSVNLYYLFDHIGTVNQKKNRSLP